MVATSERGDMTVIAACKQGGKVVIGSDSLICNGNTKSKNVNKLIKFPSGFVVGFAGIVTIHHILKELAEDLKISIRNETDARNFAKLVYTRLREDFEFNNNESCLNETAILIATSTDIYEIDPYLTCLHYDDFTAIGSGGAIAKAALRLLKDYIKVDDPHEAIRLAIDNACHFDLYCATPMYIYEVKDESPANAPKAKSTKSKRGRGNRSTKRASGAKRPTDTGKAERNNPLFNQLEEWGY